MRRGNKRTKQAAAKATGRALVDPNAKPKEREPRRKPKSRRSVPEKEAEPGTDSDVRADGEIVTSKEDEAPDITGDVGPASKPDAPTSEKPTDEEPPTTKKLSPPKKSSEIESTPAAEDDDATSFFNRDLEDYDCKMAVVDVTSVQVPKDVKQIADIHLQGGCLNLAHVDKPVKREDRNGALRLLTDLIVNLELRSMKEQAGFKFVANRDLNKSAWKALHKSKYHDFVGGGSKPDQLWHKERTDKNTPHPMAIVLVDHVLPESAMFVPPEKAPKAIPQSKWNWWGLLVCTYFLISSCQ